MKMVEVTNKNILACLFDAVLANRPSDYYPHSKCNNCEAYHDCPLIEASMEVNDRLVEDPKFRADEVRRKGGAN